MQFYRGKNREAFQEVFRQAGKVFQKNPVFAAEGFLLEQRYEEATAVLTGHRGKRTNEEQAAVLTGHQEKWPYYEVLRRFLLGLCYDAAGEGELAEEQMAFVLEHGNTMPCNEEAREWWAMHAS